MFFTASSLHGSFTVFITDIPGLADVARSFISQVEWVDVGQRRPTSSLLTSSQRTVRTLLRHGDKLTVTRDVTACDVSETVRDYTRDYTDLLAVISVMA